MMSVSGLLVLLFTCFTLTVQHHQQGQGSSGKSPCECNVYRCSTQNSDRCENDEICLTYACQCACEWSCEKTVNRISQSGRTSSSGRTSQYGGTSSPGRTSQSGNTSPSGRTSHSGRTSSYGRTSPSGRTSESGRTSPSGSTSPHDSTIPNPVLYESFDDTSGFTVNCKGCQKSRADISIPGKKNKAVRLDAKQRQWLDLGIHTEACLTQLDTCGSTGGALSMWIKLGSSRYTGIITTKQNNDGSGFHLEATRVYIITEFSVAGGEFQNSDYRPSNDWFHVVVNYCGPNNGEGFNTYFNGELAYSDTTVEEQASQPGDGRMVVGRSFTEVDNYYTSMAIDEMLIFNKVLTEQEIKCLYGTSGEEEE